MAVRRAVPRQALAMAVLPLAALRRVAQALCYRAVPMQAAERKRAVVWLS